MLNFRAVFALHSLSSRWSSDQSQLEPCVALHVHTADRRRVSSRDPQVAASVPPLDPGPRNTPTSDWPNEEDRIRKALVTGLPLGCSADFPLSFQRNDGEIVKDYESYGKKYMYAHVAKSQFI